MAAGLVAGGDDNQRVAILLGTRPADAPLRELCETLDVRLVHVPRGFEYASGATFAVREALGTLPTGPGDYTPASGMQRL